MSVVQGKNKIMVLLLICLFTAILCQLMGMTAVMAVMFMLIQTLDDESDLSQSRMIFVAAANDLRLVSAASPSAWGQPSP